MPRKPVVRSNEHPYHVSAKCNNGDYFHCELSEVWNVFLNAIEYATKEYESKIHSFVLMSNHFHLLLSTPKSDISSVMKTFMEQVTRDINRCSNRKGRVFGARYHGSIIYDHHYYDCALKYIYRNPVKAGVCGHVEDYQFSTIRKHIVGDQSRFKLEPALDFEMIVPNNDTDEFLRWMNQPFQNESQKLIQSMLRKGVFEPSKTGNNRKLLDLSKEYYSAMHIKR